MKGAQSTAPKLTKADYELLARFRYTLRSFLRFSEQAASDSGLTPQQYQALLAIEGFPGKNCITIGELAGQLQIAHHSAVGLADRLEALSFIRRTPCKEDRRRVLVSLTDEGLTALDKLYRIHRAELRSLGPNLADLLRKASESMPTDFADSENPPAVDPAPARYASSPCSLPDLEEEYFADPPPKQQK